MQSIKLVTATLLFSLTACWVPKLPGDEDPGDGDGDLDAEEESGDGDGDEPMPDLPPTADLPGGDGDGDGDGDPDPGWCCDCESGNPLLCTPSSSDACTGEGFTWCLLDAEGNPSDCEAQCEAEACTCDCENGGPSLGCTPDESAACETLCTLALCCSCLDANCWPTDGTDCSDPDEHICEPGQSAGDCIADSCF